MYLCPRCSLQYKPNEVPAKCNQCKRPLVLRKRFRIESELDQGPWGTDFDVTDLKVNDAAIVRELRVRKADMAKSGSVIERYESNKKRLGGMKHDGRPIVLDAFHEEFKNSVCYYFAFDADAWATLGDELGGPSGGADDDGIDTSGLPALSEREIDPELEAMLSKLNAERGGPPKISDKDLGELGELDTGGGGSGGGDSVPAKAKKSGGAVATKTKVVIGASLLTIILAIVAALVLI